MKLTRLCKAASSLDEKECPAVYVTEDPTQMVSQGKRLDAETTAELMHLADDEAGVLIPTETVLRAAGLFLAARGQPVVAVEVEAFLGTQWEGRL